MRFRCQKNTFRCEYGACVSNSSRCDGIKQCADGSDEKCDKDPVTSKPIITRPTTTTSHNKPTTQPNKKYLLIFLFIWRLFNTFVYNGYYKRIS